MCVFVTCYSEMLAAGLLNEGNAKTRAMARFGPGESPRSVQLYGVEAGEVRCPVAPVHCATPRHSQVVKGPAQHDPAHLPSESGIEPGKAGHLLTRPAADMVAAPCTCL